MWILSNHGEKRKTHRLTRKVGTYTGITRKVWKHTGITRKVGKHTGITRTVGKHTGITRKVGKHTGITRTVGKHTGITSALFRRDLFERTQWTRVHYDSMCFVFVDTHCALAYLKGKET